MFLRERKNNDVSMCKKELSDRWIRAVRLKADLVANPKGELLHS